MLNSQNTIDALRYHAKFAALMPGESEYATVNTLFREGKADSTIGGPWLIPAVRKAGIDIGIAPMPTVNETDTPISPFSGVQGLHVLKVASDNKDKRPAIVSVLKQITGTDIGALMASASGCAPANKLCYDLDAIKNDETVMMMKQVAENSVPMPNIPEMDVMWNVASNLLVDINMRGVDVEEAANTAQAKAEELIAAMK